MTHDRQPEQAINVLEYHFICPRCERQHERTETMYLHRYRALVFRCDCRRLLRVGPTTTQENGDHTGSPRQAGNAEGIMAHRPAALSGLDLTNLHQ